MAPVDLSNDTKNWLKAVLALKHLKEGLRPFVDQHISAFHNKLIATYGTCNHCTTENILKCTTKNACWKNKKGICQYHDNVDSLKKYRPCPNGVCDNIRDEIAREHFKKQPMWNNTDAAKWSTDAWEVARCFLPPGSKACASSTDTDCTGILSLCLHCLPLTALVDHVKHDFQQNRDNRNVLMHSGRQEITDTERSLFINDAIRLLRRYQILVSRHSQDCINTLTEIDSDGLVLTTDDVVGIMKEKVDAIHLKQEELATELQETKEKAAANAVAIVDHQTKLDSYKGDIKQLDDSLKEAHGILRNLKDHNDAVEKLNNTMETIRKRNEEMIKQINQHIEALETKVKEHDESIRKHDKRHHEHDERHKKHDERHKEHDERHKEYDERHKEHDERHKEYDERHKEYDERHKEHDERHKEYDERHKEHDERHKEYDERHKEYDERNKEHAEILNEHDKRHGEHDERHKEYDERHKEQAEILNEHDKRHEEHDERHKQLKRRMDRQEENSNQCQGQSESSTENKITADADTVAAADNQGLQNMRGRKRLRDYLIKKYKNNYSDMLVAPPKKDMWTDIGKHYREQDMRQVSMPSESQTDTGEKKKTDTVKSYNDVFCRKDKQCRNVYVKGDAGSGKSVFCLHMVNTWCGIHSSDKEQDVVISSNKQKKDIDMLRQFEFLFYIELRYATDQYDIVSMIKENLLRNNKQLSDQLTDVLENESEKCLILLDGLDEWSIPKGSKPKQGITKGLPDRDDCSDWTILTTTRPWTLESIRPNRCEMDQLIELRGLTKGSIDETIHSVVGYLNNRYSKDKSPRKCSQYLRMNNLNHIPFVLKQLVCIWFEDGKVGKTKCDMYAAMVDVYLRYADLKINQDTLSDCDKMTSCNDLPACLQNRQICQRLKQSLFKLSMLAFHTLFCKDRSSSLVFDSHTATIHGMSKEEVGLWLKIGLLSQDSIHRRSTKDEMMIAFPHKTIQEFLAAVYISMHTNPNSAVLPTVKDICVSVDMILEMSQVFVFLSGMTPATVTTISQYISEVVSADKDIQCYRNTLPMTRRERNRIVHSASLDNESMVKLIDEYQNSIRTRAVQQLMTSCIRESVDTGLTNIEVHIEDLIIDDDERSLCNVEEMFRFNKSDIISFCVNLTSMGRPWRLRKTSKSISWKQLKTNAYWQHLSRLEHLVLNIKEDDDNDDDGDVVVSIIRRNMNTLTVISLGGLSFKQLDLSQLTRLQRLQLSNFCVDHVQINTSQLEKCEIDRLRPVKSAGNQPISTPIYLTFQGDSQPLRTLTLENFAVQCELLKQLMLFVTQATGLRKITLDKITCSDCGNGCTCRLDMSQHTQLEELELHELYMSDVQINTTKLRSCEMYELKLANCIPNELGSADTSHMFHGDGKQLVELTLRDTVLKHKQLEQLMLSVTQATELWEITLNEIKCSDCGTGCTCRLDLSQHTELRALRLQELYVSDVQINTTKLHSCTMNKLRLSSCTPNALGSAEISHMFHGDGKQLVKLTLKDTVLKHEQLEQLMLSVTQATELRYITVDKIKCSDCDTGCTCRLDLSQHTQLQDLELQELDVSGVQINTTQLKFLTLTNIVLKHEHLEQLMLSVTQATGLWKITLNGITCSDCGIGCTCRLELSQHTQLLKLTLHELYMSDVQINTTKLHTCTMNTLKLSNCTPNELGSAEISHMFHGDGKQLVKLTLTDIILNHEQLEQLMLSVTQATEMRYITLNKIKCIDCGTGCTYRLDLSQHTQLEELELQELYVSDVQINTTQLKICTIDSLRLTSSMTNEPGSVGVSLMFLDDARHLNCLTLRNVALRHEHLVVIATFTQNEAKTISDLSCVDCADKCVLICDNHWGRGDVRI